MEAITELLKGKVESSVRKVAAPQGWTYAAIGELCTLINGRAFKPSDWTNTGLPIIRIQNLNNPDAKFNHFLGNVEPKFIVDNGELLFAWSGTPGTSFGAHIWTGERAVLNQHIFRVLFDETVIDKNFFKIAINQKLQELIDKAHGGVGLRHVTKGKFEQTEILLPSFNEQRGIVAKIEALKARSQRVKEELEAIAPLLDQFRQSVLVAAFRGDLTADWREKNPDVEPASVLLERIRAERRRSWEEAELKKMKAQGKKPKDDKWKEKYKEPISVDYSLLPKLADGWCWLSADECTFLITDGEHATPERSDEGIYLLSARNVLNGKLLFEKVDFVPEHIYQQLEKRLKLEAGDVLLSCSGTVGRSCVAPPNLRCAFVRSVAILKPLFEMGEYLSLAIRSPYLQAQIEKKKTQTAQANIFQGRIKTLAIPVAPFDEQKVIVQAIAHSFKLIENVERIVEDAKSRGTELDQSILAKAFRGELVPQDPNDEPASVLLERIRAEREKLDIKKKAKGKTEKKSHKAKPEATEPKQLSLPGFE